MATRARTAHVTYRATKNMSCVHVVSCVHVMSCVHVISCVHVMSCVCVTVNAPLMVTSAPFSSSSVTFAGRSSWTAAYCENKSCGNK